MGQGEVGGDKEDKVPPPKFRSSKEGSSMVVHRGEGKIHLRHRYGVREDGPGPGTSLRLP